MDSFSNIFDIIIVVGGAFMVYAAIQMKVNDIIKRGIIIPRDLNDGTLKDREGFKAYAYSRHMIEGVVLMALGIVGIGLDLFGLAAIHALVLIVALAFYLTFSLRVEKGKRQFYPDNYIAATEKKKVKKK